MTTYRIAKWSELFENNRTKDMVNMRWVPVPNRHDGDGYTTLVDRKNGAALLGAWLVILQVASKCEPRGTLLREGGKPHDAASIARMTRLPAAIIQEAIDVCLAETHWLECDGLTEIPQEGAGKPQEGAAIPQATDYGKEGKGMEGMEGRNGTERRFTRPDCESVKLQAVKIGLPESEALGFWNYYEANGWRVGKNPMKSWTAALNNWKKNYDERTYSRPSGSQSAPPSAELSPGARGFALSKELERIEVAIKELDRQFYEPSGLSETDKTKRRDLRLKRDSIRKELNL